MGSASPDGMYVDGRMFVVGNSVTRLGVMSIVEALLVPMMLGYGA